MNPEVSVVIPTFNRREMLARALDSVLLQQGVIFEVLVIDDGSTDGTAGMVREKYPSVEYFFQANRGPSAARNRAIERSRGKWICFLDSDDQWRPGKLKAQMDFAAQNPDFLIHQTEEVWIRNGRRVNPMKKHQKYGGFIFEQCLPLCIVSPSAVMIRRSVFEEAGLFDESLPACEDYDLWLRAAARFPIGLLKKAYVVKYGGHADQRSHAFPAMDQFRIQALAKILKSGTLTPAQYNAALKMLQEKSRIFIQGALKRNHAEEAEKIRQMTANLLKGKTFSLSEGSSNASHLGWNRQVQHLRSEPHSNRCSFRGASGPERQPKMFFAL